MKQEVMSAVICGVLMAWSAQVQAKPAQRAPQLVEHGHPMFVEVGLREIVPGFAMKRVTLRTDAKREQMAVNPTGTFEAFTTYEPGVAASDRIFITERATGKTWELSGLPLPHRPFSSLQWTADTLTFDRWSQPHYGIHYEIDAKRRRLITASPFPDEWYLEPLTKRA